MKAICDICRWTFRISDITLRPRRPPLLFNRAVVCNLWKPEPRDKMIRFRVLGRPHGVDASYVDALLPQAQAIMCTSTTRRAGDRGTTPAPSLEELGLACHCSRLHKWRTWTGALQLTEMVCVRVVAEGARLNYLFSEFRRAGSAHDAVTWPPRMPKPHPRRRNEPFVGVSITQLLLDIPETLPLPVLHPTLSHVPAAQESMCNWATNRPLARPLH